MGNWTPEVLLDDINFDGDIIKVKVTRMLTEEMQMMTQFMVKDDKTKEVKFSFEDSMKLVNTASKILPNRIKSIDGMKSGNGDFITAEKFNNELIKEFYFVEFTADVLAKLCEASIVQEDDEKNLELP